MATTYSFSEVSFTFSHNSLGQKIANGLGIGKITVSFLDERTTSDLASDGAVMVNKIKSGRAKITLEIQQTSSLNVWLVKAMNTLDNAKASAWAASIIKIVENYDNGLTTTANDVALVKFPDHSNAQQGEHVTWEFLSAKTEVA